MALIEHPRLAGLDPSAYVQHALHGEDRTWPETNCYVDLWIEVLHSLGLDPVAAMAFTLSTGFDGDQWQFFKYPPEDLRALYGIDIHETNIWRTLEHHVAEHLSFGHLLTLEVDAWFLPDTSGVSYRLGHQKTTIVPAAIDPGAQVLHYFHNRSLFRLEGEDYRGALRVGEWPADVLPPYAEIVALERMRRPAADELRGLVAELVDGHLARRPIDNPVTQLCARIDADLPALRAADPDFFHAYAFGTLRQLGAWAESTADFARAWLGDGAATSFADLAVSAKTCQFKLARVANGRDADLSDLYATMAQQWATGYDSLCSAHVR